MNIRELLIAIISAVMGFCVLSDPHPAMFVIGLSMASILLIYLPLLTYILFLDRQIASSVRDLAYERFRGRLMDFRLNRLLK